MAYSAQITALLPGVYETTSHPELEAESVRAIRAAVQYYHKLDFLRFDTVEVSIPEVTGLPQFSLDIATNLPSFRDIDCIKTFSTAGVLLAELEEISPKRLLDAYGYPRVDVYYNAGTTINIRVIRTCTTVQVNYFSYPDTSEANLATWLYPENEQALLDYAAMKVFSILGLKEQVANFQPLVQMHTMQILQNYSRIIGK